MTKETAEVCLELIDQVVIHVKDARAEEQFERVIQAKKELIAIVKEDTDALPDG